MRGDRSNEFRGAPAVCRALAARGFVAIAPSYRLGSCPEYIEDARDAVLWARQNAARFGADPDRLFISGSCVDSGGGGASAADEREGQRGVGLSASAAVSG